MSDALKVLERQFYSDGYRLAMKAVQSGCRGEELSRSVQDMHRLVDEVIAYFMSFAENQNQSPDCRRGCSWCCYQPVFALSYELDNLHEDLKENLSADELDAVYARAASNRSRLSKLKGEVLLNSKFACPMLVNGACIAYAARPVACRIYLSSNVDSCKKFYNEPESKDAVPALLNFPMRMGRMINEGFRAALKAGGIEAKEFRIDEFNDRGGQ